MCFIYIFSLRKTFSKNDRYYRFIFSCRTILFSSWGSEEFGLMGSTEWAEDNLLLLSQRAVSYINVDIAVFANTSFFARGSPMMKQVLYDAANVCH